MMQHDAHVFAYFDFKWRWVGALMESSFVDMMMHGDGVKVMGEVIQFPKRNETGTVVKVDNPIVGQDAHITMIGDPMGALRYPTLAKMAGEHLNDGVRIDIIDDVIPHGKADWGRWFECLGTGRMEECYCPCCDSVRKARAFPYKGV